MNLTSKDFWYVATLSFLLAIMSQNLLSKVFLLACGVFYGVFYIMTDLEESRQKRLRLFMDLMRELEEEKAKRISKPKPKSQPKKKK